MHDGVIAKRYARRTEPREPYLRRARQAARYTISSTMPMEGHTPSTPLYTPYQGLGQRGLNNLNSKLLMILMPPDQPMFKLDIDDYQLAKLADQNKARGELDEAFNRVERAVTTDLAATTIRKGLGMSLQQILVAGNVAIFQEDDGSVRVWRLDQFVVSRTPQGELKECIIEEQIDPDDLTPEQRAATGVEVLNDTDQPKPTVMYTRYWRDGGRFKLIQEVNGIELGDSFRSWPATKAPMIVPTTNRLPGETYGRGYIETVCLGDLISFEGLSKQLLEAATMAARLLWLRNPNSTVRAKDLLKANGSVINGNPNDVGVVRVDKTNDFNFVIQQAATLEKRLEQVFMLNQSVQRTGERVTATEIQFVAQDIEDALGNLYTDLASDWQLPIVLFQMARLTRKRRIPALPKGIVKPRITTGLSALGRGQDLRKIQGFTRDLREFGGDDAAALVDKSEFTKRLGAGWGIDMNGLIKTNEQMAAEAQQQQTQETSAAAVPGVAKEVAKAVAPALGEQITG